ncbi:MAG: hypothetical protein N2C14_24580 [Planctomycetales bacterium]
MLAQLARQIGRRAARDEVADVLKSLESFSADERATSLVIVKELSQGLTQANSPLKSQIAAVGGKQSAELLRQMLADARTSAADSKRPPERRAESVRALALAPFDESGELLVKLLDNREPREVQRADIAALSRYREPAATAALLERWPGFSPSARNEAAEVLFARPLGRGT